jgi:hypothetical protein
MIIIIIINALNVERVNYDHISCNWSYQHSNISFKESFGSRDKKTFSRFTIHIKVSSAV